MNLNNTLRILAVSLIAVLTATGTTSCGSRKTAVRQSVVQIEQPAATESVTSAPSPAGNALVCEARKWIGVPYKYGGTGRDGADCSGFLMTLFREAANLQLPRTTHDQMAATLPVDSIDIQPGDILFFSSEASRGKTTHVGIYVGDGRMIHASTSRGVVEDNLSLAYYVRHYLSAGRHPGLSRLNAAQPAPSDCVEAAASTPAPESPAQQVARAFTK